MEIGRRQSQNFFKGEKWVKATGESEAQKSYPVLQDTHFLRKWLSKEKTNRTMKQKVKYRKQRSIYA